VPLKKSTEKVSAPKNVVNLMDALRRSVEGGDNGKATKAPAPKKGKKRAEGQREMLLSIAGKKPAKEASKGNTTPARRKASL
jgi:DNA end-binding protein Ku